jgi:hypothetical protein
MTDRFRRGSAPGRARSEDQRPGSFRKGHKKLGGRQRGTPNKLSPEYANDILEAAHRVGADANGKFGLVGYLRWVARYHPQICCRLLGSLMDLQQLEIGLPDKPRPAVEEFDDLGNDEGTPSMLKRGVRRPQMPKPAQPPDPEAPWAWTGQDAPIGPLMHLAITDPKAFSRLFQAMLPRPTARQRGLAARRAWEERLRAEERMRTEQDPGVGS